VKCVEEISIIGLIEISPLGIEDIFIDSPCDVCDARVTATGMLDRHRQR